MKKMVVCLEREMGINKILNIFWNEINLFFEIPINRGFRDDIVRYVGGFIKVLFKRDVRFRLQSLFIR